MAARPRQVTPIPSRLVDLVLLGPADDRRQLQDSPILGDVWLAYAADPQARPDLLITPHRRTTAANVAHEIARRLKKGQKNPEPAQIAYLQGLVAARMTLTDLLRVIVPLTFWWSARHIRASWTQYKSRKELAAMLRKLFVSLQDGHRIDRAVVYDNFEAVQRYLALAGLLLWARDGGITGKAVRAPSAAADSTPAAEAVLALAIAKVDTVADKLVKLYELIQKTGDDDRDTAELIFQVSLNRRAAPALHRSVPAVKGDAARTLFKVDTSKITWAVLDSGIDRAHHAFRDKDGLSRVRRTFDFTRIRDICSIDNHHMAAAERAKLVAEVGQPAAKVNQWLKELRDNAEKERPIAWDVAERLLERDQPPQLASVHGTHVAGIIGARKPADGDGYDGPPFSDGMCPEIQLYDFRVLAKTAEDTEFAIIAALQYIRYVNERHSYVTIHGANLSLSIPHNVRNYACGRTPVCVECQRLVESGVVVVAAAGNRGYQRFETADGPFENYAAFSITDPGNSEDVITVGATHGNWPHTYGVSFFSSRGPTGDGRPKPDLVAPGERIEAPFPNKDVGAESGTSMAAPHVSGAAAMLMARYPELVGNPRRIKRILCDSATDLSRDRSFQGYGMLDVLRAFQSL
jgi:subtilisin family serine protease